MKKSNRYQINAFVHQFAALFAANHNSQPLFDAERDGNSWADASKVESVAVARVTPELLQKTPSVTSYDSGCASWYDKELVVLFDRNWQALAEVRPDDSGEIVGARSRWSRDGETIGEAIARTGCRHDVAYIVVIRTGYNIENFYSVGGYNVILYKAPKGWTISEWVAREERRARNEIAAQLHTIDTVTP